MNKLVCTVCDPYHPPRSHECNSLVRTTPVNLSGAPSLRTADSRVPEHLKIQHLSVTHTRAPQDPVARTHASHSLYTETTAPAVLDRLPRLPLACVSGRRQAPFFVIFSNQDTPLRGPTAPERLTSRLQESMAGLVLKYN